MPTIEQLESLFASSPEDPFLMYGLALEYAKADRHDDAVGWFDRCLGVDPDYCYAYYHKARSLESLDRFEDAAATLRAGIEHAKAQHDAHAQAELSVFLEEFA
jgi:tetratricopeptide (TPR) repeat protein